MNENRLASAGNITHKQIVTIICRYAQYKNYNVNAGEKTDILTYYDSEIVSPYAMEAMKYVIVSGLIYGKSVTTLNHIDNVTRVESADTLMRFFGTN